MLAVGITATTLESSMETDPDDVIDFDWTILPFNEESAKQAKMESIQNQASSGGGGGGEENQSDSGSLSSLAKALIALLVLLALLALAYRYRKRLLAVALVGRSWLVDRTPTTTTTGTTTWPGREPSDEISRAWLTMVRRADLEQPWARTPTECAQAAVDAGMDSEAVASITTLFEEVRYGDAPLTDQRRRQAREGLQRLDESGSH